MEAFATSGLRGLLFLLGSAGLFWVSRHALRRPRSHGFYRFFAWECILALVLLNFPHWTEDALSPRQLLSWFLLFVSPFLAVHAVRLLRRVGQPSAERSDAELFSFERTSRVVTAGVYRWIRHPMYAALLYLAWGAFLKHMSGLTVVLVALASLCLWLTARCDEIECLAHFGDEYADYMRRSKRFVPGLF